MFSIALTVIDSASGAGEDIVVRAGGAQTVGELAARLAVRFGRTAERSRSHTLQVRRTGETLAPDQHLTDADVLDSDVLTLVAWIGPSDPN
jgi:glucose-6-phosphate dehydrogenase assembly protein OpcA